MSSIISVVIGFLLSGLIGNWLVQKWQARAWLHQQRFLGYEKEYLALKDVADELLALLGARIFHMERVTMNLLNTPLGQLEHRLVDHDGAVKRWNERLQSFYLRLRLLAEGGLDIRLERTIHMPLQRTGVLIDKLVQRRRSKLAVLPAAVGDIQIELGKIKASARHLNEKLLSIVERQRMAVYIGKNVIFSLENLNRFSTWHLIKALFVRDINSLSILRTAIDL